MKKKEKIASWLIGLGLLGILAFAESIDISIRAFIAYETPCFAALIAGVLLSNRTAETEAPAANIMKRG